MMIVGLMVVTLVVTVMMRVMVVMMISRRRVSMPPAPPDDDPPSYVVRSDIAGAEAGFPASTHKETFELAHKNFLFKTCHASEDWGPESIFQVGGWLACCTESYDLGMPHRGNGRVFLFKTCHASEDWGPGSISQGPGVVLLALGRAGNLGGALGADVTEGKSLEGLTPPVGACRPYSPFVGQAITDLHSERIGHGYHIFSVDKKADTHPSSVISSVLTDLCRSLSGRPSRTCTRSG
jgi:hypothetical protein